MKKIKTYIVFADHFIYKHTNVYYIGKSKKAAREEFRRQAFTYMLQNKNDSVKLRLIKVNLPVSEYEYITDVVTYNQSEVRAAINDYELTGAVDEFNMVNHLTFEFDFIPWFENKAKVDVYYDDEIVNKLLSDTTGLIRRWLKKYIKKNF